jgi:hypothetical protein
LGSIEPTIAKAHKRIGYSFNMIGKKWQRKNVNIIGIWLLDASLVQLFMY